MRTRDRSLALLVGALAVAAPACGGGGAAAPAASDGGADACSSESISGIAIDARGIAADALGYAPFAIDGCRLAYIAPPASGEAAGELRLRDLATGAEVVLERAAGKPRRPAMSTDVIAWEATASEKSVVRVRVADAVSTITGPFDHAGEPRAAAGIVVFTAWRTADDLGDTDVLAYTPSTRAIVAIAAGPGQQRFADVTATHIALTDFVEDPSGHFAPDGFSASDIVVVDRATSVATRRELPGKQAFPVLGATGKIGYLHWGDVHPEPKFNAYVLRAGDLGGPPASDLDVGRVETPVPFVRPSARADEFHWVSWPLGEAPSVVRRAADLRSPAVRVEGLEGAGLYAPIATPRFTVVAAAGADGLVQLRAAARR